MKKNQVIAVTIIASSIILTVIAVILGQGVFEKVNSIRYLAQAPRMQYYFSEATGFSFKAPLNYTIIEYFPGIVLKDANSENTIELRITESFKTDTKSVLEELEFYSGNPVDVSVDTLHGFDRYQYQSGPRKGDLYYLKPLEDFLFVGLYGNDPSFKNDMDTIVASLEYTPYEKKE